MESAPAGFRASPRQRQLWESHRTSGCPATVQLAASLDSAVPDAVLDAAVATLLARNEILRTTITPPGAASGPVQSVRTAVPEVRLAEQAAHERRLAAETGQFRIARVAGDDQMLVVVTAPATIADATSLRLVCDELNRVLTGGEPAEVPVQYADYAAWHNDLLTDPERLAGRTRWAEIADPEALGASATLLGDGHAESAAGTRFRGTHPLDTTLSAGIRGLAAARKVAASTVVIAAWQVFCARMTGERVPVCVVTVSGRPFTELERAPGPFDREVPIRPMWTDGAAFADVVTATASTVRRAAESIDDLTPEWSATETLIGLDCGALDAEPVPGPIVPLWQRQDGVLALHLSVGVTPAGLVIEFDGAPGVVDSGRATELVERFTVLLRSAVRAPDRSVDALNLLRPDERTTLVGPPAAAPTRSFAEQVRETPDAIAVQHAATTLTYTQLDTLADGIARRLRDAGVAAGDRVVVRLARSPEFLATVLACVRIGAVYVPVDLRQPWSRVEFVLGETGADVLVTAQAVPAGLPIRVVRPEPVDGPSVPPHVADPDEPVYVMYTSGSTGVPNGVVVTHRGLGNYLDWAIGAYDLAGCDGAVVGSSVGFDLTVTGLLAPLAVGGRVVLVPETDGLADLVTALRAADGRYLLKITPSHLSALRALMTDAELTAHLHTLVLGGEGLRVEAIEPVRAASPDLLVVNEYGPTEATVGCVAHRVGPATPTSGRVPIGDPIAGTVAVLLDPLGKPVPDGVAGELHVGGACLAQGYFDRPELTAARFVTDPDRPGELLYRTGDRARRNRLGELEYLGRVDDQIKLRGYRIEPGEIEAALVTHPRIAAAVVTVQDDQLVAHVVANDESGPPSTVELDAHCRALLADYLVPVRYAVITEFPVTANGKLDRSALRASAATVAPYVAPRTDTEEILANAMAAVLGRGRVGIDDNYFVIGGDSIRSVMVASRTNARGVEVSVADLHRNPTVRQLADAIAEGRTAGDERRTAPFDLVSDQDRALMPADVEDAFPLNLLQEGMIFHRAFAAKSAVYHAIASVRLKAPFDLEILRTVIDALLRRHPMLRVSFDQTTFSTPLQLVHSTFDDPLSFEDLRGLDPGEQQNHVRQWVEQEKQRGFELDEHPLIRFMAQRLDDESFQFTYGFHHEIVDGWSEALLVTELFGHYFSLIYGEPIQLREPTATMRDAIALEIDALHRDENYEFWSRYLDGANLMRLPRPDGRIGADDGAREIVRIAVPVSVELSTALKALAVSVAVPLKSVLLAAHMAVMNSYHGQPDTLTYTVTNGRPEGADGSTAIGLFVNSLALRVRMDGGSWRELIEQTLDSERASLPYRRLPMAELKRHQGNEPLAETLFFFTDYHVFHELDRWQRRGVEHVASELYGESTFPFCAIFRLNRDTGALEVRLEYDGLQFSSALMDHLRDAYRLALESMVAAPDGTYHDRCLLPDGERDRLLHDWNAQAPADGAGVLDRISRWCTETPAAVALESGAESVTYGELDRRTGELADRLVGLGAGPGTLVAVHARRDPSTVVTLLAVLRTGAAYVPIDPGWPNERRLDVLAEAAPVLVVTPGTTLDATTAVEKGPGKHATAERSADDPAYVLYTSGSTGTPKGVVVSHRALAHSTAARTIWYGADPARFLLVSALSFDSSVAGLYWSLCTGATLVLAPEGSQIEPRQLAELVRAHGVTHVLAVPSLLSAVLDAADDTTLDSLRSVIAAGEAVNPELVRQVGEVIPGAEFVNEYGPTENTVWSTAWRANGTAGTVPIGRPVPGVRAYVLDAYLRPAPVGVAAELYLAGDGLALGYLGRPALTAASFVPDPFAEVPGRRMYRTGDLVRHTESGDLEFLARTDQQVKIRGFRVEPGDVEAAIDTHPDVRRSVVVARPDGAGDLVLVAYVVAEHGTGPDSTELQRHVRGLLPKYMVPSTCVVLDALPLTGTGKVDRSSLPTPDAHPVVPSAPAQGATEQTLAAIWCQALGIEQVGRDDEFFALGGESLRAMHVVTRTNKLFGLDLSVRALFDAPTIAGFAATVERTLAGARAPVA